MADKKISQLTLASTPLSGGETLPVVQTGATVQVSVNNLTAGRAVSATSISAGLGAAGTPAYTFTGDTNTGMWSPGADTIAFSEGGVEAMRITGLANVGIGTTSAGSRLTVSDTSPTDGIVARFNNTTSGAGVECGIRLEQGSSSQLRCDLVTFRAGANAGLDFAIKQSDNTGVSQTRFYITELGNVGIGETAPDYKLDVNGTFGFTPGASVTPVDNGDVVFELTNNTTLTVKAKGSDGVVRSATLTLA